MKEEDPRIEEVSDEEIEKIKDYLDDDEKRSVADMHATADKLSNESKRYTIKKSVLKKIIREVLAGRF